MASFPAPPCPAGVASPGRTRGSCAPGRSHSPRATAPAGRSGWRRLRVQAASGRAGALAFPAAQVHCHCNAAQASSSISHGRMTSDQSGCTHKGSPPEMRPSALNWISVNLPKREELSLRTVLALPNASSRGLDSSTCAEQEWQVKSQRQTSGQPHASTGRVQGATCQRLIAAVQHAKAASRARRHMRPSTQHLCPCAEACAHLAHRLQQATSTKCPGALPT